MEFYRQEYLKWLESSSLSIEEKNELASISDNETDVKERFYTSLEFGTAGLRGKMRLGTNAMNKYTVAQATQGLANLIIKENRANDGVVIAYDSRNNSELFAKVSASVLAANGIKTYIFDELRPTPELSFALRELHCVAGINITASHNPKEYNGYKAYWEDGAQLPPEHAKTVSLEIEKIDIFNDVKYADFDKEVANGNIVVLDQDMDEKYLAAVMQQLVNPDAIKNVANDLQIVYSPLHGTGYRLIPDILARCGVEHLYVVPEQMEINGDFPTVEKPNPEYSEVFELGIEIANNVGSTLVIATDPDADRVGVVTKNNEGNFVTISGNQMGALLIDYIITAYEETGTMPNNPYAVKTIVSTELVAKICEAHNVKLHNVLTGFKFIGEVIKNYEQAGADAAYLFGFEESYGYLKGTYARDKDAVVATMLICEMTAFYHAKGMTLFDALNGLYEKYGYYLEANQELYMHGIDGKEKMAALMDTLRNNAPESIANNKIVEIGDYLKGTITNKLTGTSLSTNLPSSNVISFKMENGDVVIARPSGTEPKIKFYYLLSGISKDEMNLKLDAYKAFINSFV
ncbi:MAG: phospho-sugar mutase [Clostridia bacterium]|nr:phospho-sugar mutase [Clostridia bacterium]